jgi:hypothetical protein
LPRNHNKTGRTTKGERHIRIPLYVLESAAYRCLSLAARAALVEALAFYRGDNNGWLGLPARTLAARMGVGKSTVARALRDLEDIGFIECMSIGMFRRRDRRASEYRITFLQCDRGNLRKTNEFMSYVPVSDPNARSHQRDRTVPAQVHAKEDNLSRSHQEDRQAESKTVHGPVDGTQIVYQGRVTVRGNVIPFQPKEEFDNLEIPAFLDRRVKQSLAS